MKILTILLLTTIVFASQDYSKMPCAIKNILNLEKG